MYYEKCFPYVHDTLGDGLFFKSNRDTYANEKQIIRIINVMEDNHECKSESSSTFSIVIAQYWQHQKKCGS